MNKKSHHQCFLNTATFWSSLFHRKLLCSSVFLANVRADQSISGQKISKLPLGNKPFCIEIRKKKI